jgi:hypothetical protein
MDPQGEPDLDAIARDLADVEAELDRLAAAAAPAEDDDASPGPASS